MSAAESRDTSNSMRVARFLEVLGELRILSAEDQAAVEKAWASRANSDAQLLAKELVQHEKITRYQAAAIYQGKTRGLVLNQYVVLDKLGSGGMGNVYKGRHRETGDVFAIKVMSSASMRSADSVKRFQREAEMAARLNHPNIVRGIEGGSADGLHYFVMEFVDGFDLSNYLKQQGPIPYLQVLQCITQAAQGLDFAHTAGIVHRDIKPGNLFLCKDGTIKLLDLGLARCSDFSEGAATQANEGLTQTGQVMGTVDYMAPEQALNTRHADARSDIYSLGCSLYRLITGEIPFNGQSVVEKILAHREQPVPSVRTKFPDIPLGVDFVLSRMLSKRPDDRYQTMREVIYALQSASKPTGSTGALPTPALAESYGLPLASIANHAPAPIATPVNVNIPIALSIPSAIDSSSSLNLAKSIAPVAYEARPATSARGSIWLWGTVAAGVAMLLAAFVYSRLNGDSQEQVVQNEPAVSPVVQVKVPDKRPEPIATTSPPVVSPPNPSAASSPAPRVTAPPAAIAAGRPVPAPTKVSSSAAPQPAAPTVTASVVPAVVPTTNTSPRLFEPTVSSPDYRKTMSAEAPPPYPENLIRLTPDEEVALAARIKKQTETTVYYRDSKGGTATFSPQADLSGVEFRIIHIKFPPHKPIQPDIWQDVIRLKSLISISLSDTNFGDGHLDQLCRAMPQIVSLNLWNTDVTEVGLSHLQQLSQLYEVALSDHLLTDQGAAYIASCPTLTQLYLDRMTLSVGAVQKLVKAPNLRTLGLTGTSVDDEAVKDLRVARTLDLISTAHSNVTAAGRAYLLQNNYGLRNGRGTTPPLSVNHPYKSAVMRPGVGNIAPEVAAVEREVANYFHAKKLTLRLDITAPVPGDRRSADLPTEPFIVTDVTLNPDSCTPADFAQLKRLSGLRVIVARDCPVNDDSLQVIAEIGTLRGLNLQGATISTVGIRHLAKLRNLELVSLQNTPLTDEAVGEFQAFKNLKWLNLAGTKLTSQGAKQLLTVDSRLETVVLAGIPLNAQVFLQTAQRVPDRLFDLRGTGLDANALVEFVRNSRGSGVEFMHEAGMVSGQGIRSLQSRTALPPTTTATAKPTSPASVVAPQTRPAGAPLNAPATKLIVSAADLETARQATRTRFKEELANAREPNNQAMLANLVSEATRFNGEPAAQLAMLCEARDAAAELGAINHLLTLHQHVSAWFEIDVADWYAAGLDATAGKKMGFTPAEKLATAARELAEKSIKNRDLAASRTLLEAAQGVAKRNNRTVLVRTLGERRAEMETLARAIETLAKTPDASHPNTTLARQTCFLERNWPATFAHLAKSSDAGTKEAAEASLAKPATAEDKLRVADLWWNRAEKASNSNTGPVLGKEELQVIAAYWYDLAKGSLTGLSQAKAEKRLETARPAIRKFDEAFNEARGTPLRRSN
ncbi:MAG: protein kinase [Planctomycetaceae bacterium]|nr:protein kinase [Planctomycetaceae bacterium]